MRILFERRTFPLALLPLLATAVAFPRAAHPQDSDLQLGERDYVRVERQANTFTKSRQDAPAIARAANGASVVVWQSRRQQEGTYGIYARRFGADGQTLGDEVVINASTRGMQMQPAVAIDDQGASWFAWRSFGHDGDAGAILARRFSSTLAKATPEVLVNEITRGHQTDPVIAPLPGGGALVVWLSPAADGDAVEVHARRMGSHGEPDGPALRIDAGHATHHRTPSLATDAAGNAVVVYARSALDGTPVGIFARYLAQDGKPRGEELRIDFARDVSPVEPVVACTPKGEWLVAWLESEASDYAIRVRGYQQVEGALRPGPVRELAVSGEGYTSGLAIALDGNGHGLVAWNRYADGPRLQPGLFARRVDASGKPIEAAFRVTERSEGDQALAAASGAPHVWLDADGRMAFAWHGDAGLGDDAAANVTFLAPANLGSSVALAAAAPIVDAPFTEPESGARPHDPPTFDRRDIETDRTDDLGDPDSVTSFLGFTSTGWTPPDPEFAVGPDHIVSMVNGGISFFLKDGTMQFFDDINGAGGFFGSVGAGGFVFDPEVVWDPHDQRFIAFANERNGSQGNFLFAVSDDADPNGAWFTYKINGNPLINDSDIDSPNVSVDENVIYMGADYFGGDKFLIVMVDKSSVLNGGNVAFTSTVIQGRQSFGMPVNYDVGSPAQYMVWAREFQTSTQLDIYAITDPLGTPAVQNITVTVPSYSHPADPPQQGTSVRPELFEARFWSAMVRDGQLWCTHHQGANRAVVRWYQFDLANWPTSGVPTLVQSGDVDLGAGVSTFFGSIWADADSNMALTFARSASDEFISMQMTSRRAGDPAGTTAPPLQVRSSNQPDNSGRWGDYSATNSDPASPNTFWGTHEYRRTSGWRTRIGRLSLCDGSITSYCVTSPNSVGAGAMLSTSGSNSVSANDLTLIASDCPPNQFGLFFYGQGQAQNPVGDGFICLASNFIRLPAQSVDSLGVAAHALDIANPPAGGQITAGATWNFQFWYRDPMMGTGSNLSDALEIEFCR